MLIECLLRLGILIVLTNKFHKIERILYFPGQNNVSIETDIMDIMDVNDKEFSVTLSMYFSVKWDEPRFETNNTVGEDQWTPIDLQFMNQLWVPNIFIYDLRRLKDISTLKNTFFNLWYYEPEFFVFFYSLKFLDTDCSANAKDLVYIYRIIDYT